MSVFDFAKFQHLQSFIICLCHANWANEVKNEEIEL